MTLRLRTEPQVGAAAQGIVTSRAVLRKYASGLASRAGHYNRLQLSLTDDAAIFWSAEICELPWLGNDVQYLGPPCRRIFLPIGWQIALPDTLLNAALACLPMRCPPRTPLLVMPHDRGVATADGVRVIELCDSLSASAVDWRALSRMPI
jgi:hypothetical protein